MFKHMGLLMALTILTSWLSAQSTSLTGVVLDEQQDPLPGATVYWQDGDGTVTDTDGTFRLDWPETGSPTLVVSFVGFRQRELQPERDGAPLKIILAEGAALSEVEVTARDRGNFTSVIESRNVESITSKELRKAPCCSLAESFETNPTVSATYADPLTGTREIQLLGLRGTYTQLTLEKRPAFTGLATPYALDYVPGTWLEGIQIGKGAGSLESGSQGLSGQINTELVKPMLDHPLFINLFASSGERGEANIHLNRQFNDQWSSGLLLHGSFMAQDHDFNHDYFQDMPERQTGIGMYRLFYQGESLNAQFNALGVRDRRQAGQVHEHGTGLYRINQNNDRAELFGKVGYFGFAKPYQSMGLVWNAAYHRLSNTYGLSDHRGDQRSAYLNWLYASIIGTTDHQFTVGTTYRLDEIDEQLSDRIFDRTDRTLSAFGEYTYQYEDLTGRAFVHDFTLIAGLRLDHHNRGGFIFVPRLNAKLSLSDKNALRLSAGRAWRSPNVLVENLAWLPSSREVIAEGPLDLEDGWNMGFNFTQQFLLAGREGDFVVDAYRTVFNNQIVVDAERDAEGLYFYNLPGRSFSNSLLFSASWEVLPKLDVKLAWKGNRTRLTYARDEEGWLREPPLLPRQRALATLSYEARRWRFNTHYQWVGPQRLIDQDIIPESVPVALPRRAPSYGLLNAQFTYKFMDNFEVYAGGENLTGVRQRNIIIGADDPFGEYFDATQVYQPLNGAMFYLGLRFHTF